MLGEIAAGLDLWDRLKKMFKGPATNQFENVASRFFRLFESHGVHRNQVPRYLDCGLKLKDVQDDSSLMAALDESILNNVCEHFSIRREWLDGADLQAHPCHDFYKDHEGFADFLITLRENRPEAIISGVLVAPATPDRCANTLLILEEEIGWIGEKRINRYHLCNNWDFSYWKSRAYLTACVAIAWQRKIYIHGVYVNQNEINVLANGNILLGWNGEGIWDLGPKRWDPEDMALRPEVFLMGIDPEVKKFGLRAGLSMWLELEEKGWMRTGLDRNVRHLFQEELARYK
jgi:hypothetical protein